MFLSRNNQLATWVHRDYLDSCADLQYAAPDLSIHAIAEALAVAHARHQQHYAQPCLGSKALKKYLLAAVPQLKKLRTASALRLQVTSHPPSQTGAAAAACGICCGTHALTFLERRLGKSFLHLKLPDGAHVVLEVQWDGNFGLDHLAALVAQLDPADHLKLDDLVVGGLILSDLSGEADAARITSEHKAARGVPQAMCSDFQADAIDATCVPFSSLSTVTALVTACVAETRNL